MSAVARAVALTLTLAACAGGEPSSLAGADEGHTSAGENHEAATVQGAQTLVNLTPSTCVDAGGFQLVPLGADCCFEVLLQSACPEATTLRIQAGGGAAITAVTHAPPYVSAGGAGASWTFPGQPLSAGPASLGTICLSGDGGVSVSVIGPTGKRLGAFKMPVQCPKVGACCTQAECFEGTLSQCAESNGVSPKGALAQGLWHEGKSCDEVQCSDECCVVEIALTVDNVYALYRGTDTAVTELLGTDASWPTVESYSVCLKPGERLYVAGWGDELVFQGFLSQVSGPQGAVMDGAGWDVFATGVKLALSAAPPSLATMTAAIANPFVPPVIGPPNGVYPGLNVPALPSAARWIWHESGNCPGVYSPFRPGCDHDEFLVFRFDPATVCKAATGACCTPEGCLDLTAAECDQASGAFDASTSCAQAPALCCDAAQPPAACCLGDACDLLDECKCLQAGGTYQAGATCDDALDTCCDNQTLGACCTGKGCLEQVTDCTCKAQGGAWYANASCQRISSVCCLDPTLGACCFGGDCKFLPACECAQAGGSFNPGATCEAPGMCCTDKEPGACCVTDAAGATTCHDGVNACWCEAMGGAFNVGNTCADDVCEPGCCPVDIAITADNFLAVYTGTSTEATSYLGTHANLRTAAHFSTCLTDEDDYVYVAAWSDKGVYQGLLGQLSGANGAVYLDHPAIEVLATGVNISNASQVPSLLDITSQLGGSWGPVTVGNPNANIWPIPFVPGIDSVARWVWFESGNCPHPLSPFRPGCNHDEYLIFRIPAWLLCGEPPSACCLPGGCAEGLTEADCIEQGGTFNAGVRCDEVECCPDPTSGACCNKAGCTDVPNSCACDAIGGSFQPGVACSSPVACCDAELTGACCRGGVCEASEQCKCALLGGVFSPGLSCADVAGTCCPSLELGACCLGGADPATGAVGDCVHGVTSCQCAVQGGSFTAGATCDDVLCCPNTDKGACCYQDSGSGQVCADVANVCACDALGGTFSPLVSCGSTPSPCCDAFTFGACCFGEECIETNDCECQGAGGQLFPGQSCGEVAQECGLPTECVCPPGYTPNPAGDGCFSEQTTAPSAGPITYTVCAGANDASYSMHGTRFSTSLVPSTFEIPPSGSPTSTCTDPSTCLAEPTLGQGYLSQVGVWACAPQTVPNLVWVGFSQCVNFPTAGEYLVGIAGDNQVRLRLDGVELYQSASALNFRSWNVLRVPVTSGQHIIELFGMNNGGVAAFGAEVWGPFPAGSLSTPVAMRDAYVAALNAPGQPQRVFSTEPLRTASPAVAFDSSLDGGSGLSCPQGFALDLCGPAPVCTFREEVPCEDAPVQGACCVEGSSEVAGGCLEGALLADCLAQGGTFTPGASCDEADCCDTTTFGACCVGNECFETVACECQQAQGDFGPGLTCEQLASQCCYDDAPGACCYQDVTGAQVCAEVSNACECDGLGGAFSAFASCADVPSPCCDASLFGACCIGNECVETNDCECQGAQGDFAPGLTCEQIASQCCHDDTPGACCLPDAAGAPTCAGVANACECDALGGAFSPLSTCDDVPSPCCDASTFGACCFGEECIETNDCECQGAGGQLFPGQSCQEIAALCCADSTKGACCYQDTTGAQACADVPNECACDALGGVFTPTLACGTVPSPCCDAVTVGACCLGGECIETSACECQGNGGVFSPGLSCADVAPGCAQVTECICPPGYTSNPDGDGCFAIQTTAPTVSSVTYEVCAGSANNAYSMLGTRFSTSLDPADFEFPVFGSNTPTCTDPSVCITESIIGFGYLNQVGVWTCGPQSTWPDFEWVGFSQCVDFPAAGEYLVGIAGDNQVMLRLDGVTLYESVSGLNFRAWQVLRVPVTSGQHIIELFGLNEGSDAAFGAEIWGPFAAGTLDTPTAMRDAYVAALGEPGRPQRVFSTEPLRTASPAVSFDSSVDGSSGLSCPPGYALDLCDGTPVCTLREEAPCEDPASLGACCVPGVPGAAGDCLEDVLEAQCDLDGGSFTLGATCEQVDCCDVNVLGACCLGTGCSETDACTCLAEGGALFPGQSCDDVAQECGLVAGCTCPLGFTATPAGDGCYALETAAPTVGSPTYEVCPGDNHSEYSMRGTRFSTSLVPSDFEDALGGNIFNSCTNPSLCLAEPTLQVGHLSQVGVWACTTQGVPFAEWIGLSRCVDFPEAGEYMVGIAGDNHVMLRLDGDIVYQSVNAANYRTWHVLRFAMSSGPHVIELFGMNDGQAAAFGGEIWGPYPFGALDTPQAMRDQYLVAIADPDLSMRVFSTEPLRTATPPATLDTSLNGGSGMNCASGFALNTCGPAPLCTLRTDAPCGP